MFKKLQNLLFDDEELNEEEDIEEVEEPIEAPAHRKPVPSVPSATQSSMARIDVTQPIETIRESKPVQDPVVVKPAVQHASPKPLNTVETPVVPQPVKPTLGITVDDAPVVNKPKPTVVKTSKPVSKKPSNKSGNGSLYEFRPVISPIFGVDEKNAETMQAVRKSATLDREGAGSEVLSPIYGVKDYSGKKEAKEEVKPVRMERKAPAARPVEREVPEFSLDDILNAREEEYKKEVASEDVIDETTVIDPTLAPFGNVSKEKGKK